LFLSFPAVYSCLNVFLFIYKLVLQNKQVEFMAYVFGSPERYTGKDIAQAHQQLIDEKGLNETHFDIVITHFEDTMKELNVPDSIIEQAVAILMTSRPVFERPPAEKDIYESALAILKKMRHDKKKQLKSMKDSLSAMGIREEGQLQLLRSAAKMRSVDMHRDIDGAIDELIELSAGGGDGSEST
jgi:hypothetical protein